MINSQRGSLHFYLAAIILALVAIGLGIWEALVDRQDGGWLIQLVLPALLVIVLVVLHSQARRDRIAHEKESESDGDDKPMTDPSES